MSRSIKKGPFVAPELIKRVEEMNKTGEKKVLKTWSRSSTIFPSSSVTRSPSTTVASTFPFIFRKIWSATSWARSLPPVRSAAIPRRNKEGECRTWKLKHI